MRGLQSVVAYLRGKNVDGASVDLTVDEDGNLKVVTEAITIENVNVISPLGTTVGSGDNVALGAIDDPSWSGSGDGTLISISKAEYDRLTSLLEGLGGVADSPWNGSGDANLISSTKGVWDVINTLVTDSNTKLDSVVSATSILATLQTLLETIRDDQQANRTILTDSQAVLEAIQANTAG